MSLQISKEEKEALRQIPGCFFQENAPLDTLCTFAAGGRAALLLRALREESWQAVWQFLRGHHLPFVVLGAGSNILPPEGELEAIVLHMDRHFAGVRVNGEILEADAGAPLYALAASAARHGLAGLAPLCGIPGSLGGAVYMNAGAYEGSLADTLESVRFLDASGQLRTLPEDELQLAYRHSRFMEETALILSARFRLRSAPPPQIYREMAGYQARRRASQPLEEHSAGSSFKRPTGYFVGKLVTEAGLKGRQWGRAGVSAKHAGFIVNRGGASVEEIRHAFREVEDAVYTRFGVRLEPEVQTLSEHIVCLQDRRV